MKIKILLISLSVISFCLNLEVKGQDVDLATKFSQREITGTARMQGMGGVSSSLGGDISSTIGNPAGLGFFNRSEFSFSPSIGIHNADATYLGQSTNDYKTNFNFGTIGVVLNNSKTNPQGAWRGGSFGISMTRINDFHSQLNYRGSNPDNDFIGFAIDEANSSAVSMSPSADPANFLPDFSYLAYQTYLIDPYEANGRIEFDSQIDPPAADFPVQQSEIINTKGAGYSTNFSYGGNFADKLYLGASIAFSSIDYEIERIYREVPSETALNNLTLSERRSVEGTGFNLSLGAIYRPVSSISLGVSYTTPTYYSMEDAGNLSLVSVFNEPDSLGATTYTEVVDYAPYTYEYRTPGRVNAGVSYFVGKHGFISADVEYLDYAGNKYSSNQSDFSLENSEIDASLKSVVNYRIGGEYRLNIFRFRGGYAFFDDPVNGGEGIDRSRQSFSLGAGIKLPKYYVDLAVVNTRYESAYVPYFDGPVAAIDRNSTRAMLTLGFNF